LRKKIGNVSDYFSFLEAKKSILVLVKIGFKSLTENIDTTTSGGKLVFHIFGALAEFERDIIRERTNAGLQAARARGRKGGRPKALTPKKAQMVQDLYRNKENSIDEICKTLNISRATLYRYIKA
jgi:DNA invertase Pin-like site-specific DNA recombinase